MLKLNRKSLLKLTVALWLLIGITFPLAINFVPKARAEINTSEQDQKRRKIFAAVTCLTFPAAQFIIDEDDDLQAASLADVYSDLFDDDGRKEKVVVGFDLDGTNAVQTCETVVRAGLIAAGFANNTEEAQRYFIKNIVGEDYKSGQEIKPTDSTILTNARLLGDSLKTELNKIDSPSAQLKRIRVADLVNVCFTSSTQRPSGFDANRGDFEVDGLGYFQQRDNMKPSDFEWLNLNDGFGTLTNAEIGDIELNFEGGGPGWKQDNSDGSSDFYPIGPDISETNGYTANAIVDCHFVAKNKGWIFADNVSVQDDKAVFTDSNGNQITTVGGSADATDGKSCESVGGLAWIACPIVKGVASILDWVDRQLVNLLRLEKDRYNNPQLEGAWRNLRNLAYMILIPIMLIMVIATALGFQVFDAYTVKKALPRMIAATIFISLSFNIMVFVVDFVQVVGNGIQNIILAPFDMDSSTRLSDIMPANIAGGVADYGILAGLVGAAVVGATSTGGGIALLYSLLGIAGTLALTILLIFVLLLLRQTLIILLILISPLAILPWIFPGRDKLFSLWSKTFWLMVWFFPLVMMAIAAGKAMAKVVIQ